MAGETMEAEIREQPALLADNAARYFDVARTELDGARFQMALLAARGSSDHAALYARYLIEIHLGMPAELAAPSVWTRYGVRVRYPSCLAVGVSQSGAAPDVAEVILAMRKGGHATLGITNTPDSKLTQSAEHSVLLGCGEERSVAATKTYTCSLLALYELTRALGGALPTPTGCLPDAAWLEVSQRAAAESSGAIVRSPIVFVLARGYDFCTANETALKLMECALIPAKSYSTADFQHGPRALAGHGSAAVVFGDAPEGLAEQGCFVIRAPQPPERVPPPLHPIWNALFGQWLALHCSRARGLNADDPQHLRKVTETL